jgi:hypothetical protein
MTISDNRGTEKTIDQIVLTAYVQAGLVNDQQRLNPPQWADKLAVGRDYLNSIVNSLQVEGVPIRSQVLYNLSIEADIKQYALPSYVLDVVGDAVFQDSSSTLLEAQEEYLVQPATMAQWQVFPDKSSSSTPEYYMLYKSYSPMNLFLWPIPDENGYLRLQVQRLSADSTTGTNTVDLGVTWTEYLEWRLAFRLAMSNSLPADKCQMLNAEAKGIKTKLLQKSNETAVEPLSFMHSTPWSGYRNTID